MSETCFDGEPLASVITICQPHFAAMSLKLFVSARRHGLLLSVCAKRTFRGVLLDSLGRASSACAVEMPKPIASARSDPASGRTRCGRVCRLNAMSSSSAWFSCFLCCLRRSSRSLSRSAGRIDYFIVNYYWSITNNISYRLFCFGNYPNRCAFDERTVELHHPVPHRRARCAVVFFLQQRFDGPAAQFVVRQHDRRQRRMRVPGDLLVVVAEHRNVFRHAVTELLQGLDRAECHQVVRAEDRGGRIRLAHQRERVLEAGAGTPVAVAHEF